MTNDHPLSFGLTIFHVRKAKILFRENFVLLPDQIQFLNPIMVLILIPTFNYLLYPLLAKAGFPNGVISLVRFPRFWLVEIPFKCRLLRTPLQKITTGMFLASLAFVVSGTLQLFVEGKCKNGSYIWLRNMTDTYFQTV